MTEEIRELLERIRTEPNYDRMVEMVMRVNRLWDEMEARRKNGKQRGTAA